MDRKRAWVYCRVAHDGPDSADVLANQKSRLESYAKERGFEIVGASCDTGNGVTMDRPGLRKFQAAAETGAADILLILKLSRLGRDTDKVTKYCHLLRGLGIRVHTADCGEVDLSRDTALREMIAKMKKRSG